MRQVKSIFKFLVFAYICSILVKSGALQHLPRILGKVTDTTTTVVETIVNELAK